MAGGRDGKGRTSLDLRFELDLLEGDELAGELVPGLVHDAVGALADLLYLLEVLHDDRHRTLHYLHNPRTSCGRCKH